MKIIHVLKGKADPNTMNGVNKVVHFLATYGKRQGLDVEVWGIANTPDIRHEHSYLLRLFPPFRNRFFPGKEIKAAIAALGSDTIIHMHSVFLPELYAVSRLLRKQRIPWVLTPHAGYNAESMKKNMLVKQCYMILFERKILEQSRALHAISEEESIRLTALVPNRSVVSIPNGQEIGLQDYIREKSSSVQRPIFAFCGRLEQRHKGLDLLLEGFAQYRSDHGAGLLWLIGDGPHRRQLEEQTERLGLNDSVIFWGPLFGEEKLNRLAEADVFVHTSRWEGLPTAVLEAAAIGLPTLVSEETGLGHVIKKYNSGYVLSRNTPKQIAAALSTAEDDYISGLLSEKSEAIRNMIVECFDWNDIIHKMNAFMYVNK